MIERYSITASADLLHKRFGVDVPDFYKPSFNASPTHLLPVITHEETLRGTAALTPLVSGELLHKEEQADAQTYRLTTRYRNIVSLPQTITNKEITSEFGGGDIDRILTLDLFNNLLPLDEGLTVLTCNIRHLDSVLNGLAVKTTRQLHSGVWQPIEGTHVDEKWGIKIDIERQTVAAGTTGGLSGSTYTEIRPHDIWKSISIASRLDPDSLPEDTITYGGLNKSFPPELRDAVIDWAFAECGCSFSFSAVLLVNFDQYNGPVKARMTEQFYNGVPPDDVTITQFFPQAHKFGFAWASTCGDSDGNCRTKSGAPEFYVPLCLHDDLSLSVGANVWTFPATNPAVLPHGDYIMLTPHVERWRFGVFRRVLTEVLIP